ncbi:hypothetical protein L218DRAFT_430931 [Marasmius fiardii PR-910]|nr:hypothetical protein L218DRAFT_430931 [Marasmius fiardii PR-910]
MEQGIAPTLSAGLALLSFFGLNSTTAQIFAAFILILILGSLSLHFYYPCRSYTALRPVVDQATTLYDECLARRAFSAREYGIFTLSLEQVTTYASRIAVRTYPKSTGQSFYREYLERVLFFWEGLRYTVNCHRQAQLLIHDLDLCLKQFSRFRAEYELQTRLGRHAARTENIIAIV